MTAWPPSRPSRPTSWLKAPVLGRHRRRTCRTGHPQALLKQNTDAVKARFAAATTTPDGELRVERIAAVAAAVVVVVALRSLGGRRRKRRRG